MELTASEYESLDSVCHNFTLLEDQLLEPDETITFQLNTTDSFINFSQDSAVFTILDSVKTLSVHVTFVCGHRLLFRTCNYCPLFTLHHNAD